MKRLILVLTLAAFFALAQGGLSAQTKDSTAASKSSMSKGAMSTGTKATTTKTTTGDDKGSKSKQGKGTATPKDEAVGKTKDGKTVYEGAKQGHYYLNDKGDKVYVKDFEGAKIVGKTKDGRNIYEGSRGGHFYYTASGNKKYVNK